MTQETQFQTLLTLYTNFLEKQYQIYLKNNPDKYLKTLNYEFINLLRFRQKNLYKKHIPNNPKAGEWNILNNAYKMHLLRTFEHIDQLYKQNHLKNFLKTELPKLKERYKQHPMICEFDKNFIDANEYQIIKLLAKNQAYHNVIQQLGQQPIQKTSIIQREDKPTDFIEIKGQLSEEQINHFFSFLYKETNQQGEPFLSEGDTKELLKFGFGYSPSSKKFNLNLKPNRKGVFFYSIQQLFNRHSLNVKQKQLYKQFVLSSFHNFERDNIITIHSSFRNKKPSLMSFELDAYFSI